MRGHQSIVAARKAGYKPGTVFFEIGFPEAKIRYPFQDPERFLETGQDATVRMSLAEPWSTHDLRFITGCNVIVNAAGWGNDLTALLDKMAANGATQIIAAVPGNPVLLHYKQGNWIAYPA